MTESPFVNRTWRERATRKSISVALLLSALVHVAVMWQRAPKVLRASSELAQNSEGRSALSVQLAPRANPPSPSSPPIALQRPAPPVVRPPVRRSPERTRRAPPVLSRNSPDARIAAAPPSSVPPPAPRPSPPRASAEGDLASYIESRRRARGESNASTPATTASKNLTAEDENARANRIAAANLGTDRTPTFGADTSRGGGIFSIQRMSYDYAEFLFFGWNKDIRRNTTQLIEVRKGANSDIRIAVVRRMIAIIRDHETGDFVFESTRLGRNVTLSARASDTAGLEDFMMREFFGDVTAR